MHSVSHECFAFDLLRHALLTGFHQAYLFGPSGILKLQVFRTFVNMLVVGITQPCLSCGFHSRSRNLPVISHDGKRFGKGNQKNPKKSRAILLTNEGDHFKTTNLFSTKSGLRLEVLRFF